MKPFAPSGSKINANQVTQFSLNTTQWEVYSLTISSTSGPMEYEIGSSIQVGDQAVTEYYYQILDKFINFGLLDETQARICENIISTYGESTVIQPYLDVPSIPLAATQLNQHDRKILAWTNYWNNRAREFLQVRLRANANRDFIPLDPNFVKAIMFQESKNGKYTGSDTGHVDPMQVLNIADKGILTVARKGKNKDGDWGIPTNGIPLAIAYLDHIEPTPDISTALGVRWLLWKYNLSAGDIWLSAKNYNGKIALQANGINFSENYATSVEGLYITGLYKQFLLNAPDWSPEYIVFIPAN